MTKSDKLSIRPSITTIDMSLVHSSTETFQNTTLRPILKLQNDLIVVHFQQYLNHKKINLSKLNPTDAKTKISELIKKDNTLKIELRMLVVSLFTVEEYHLYLSEQKAFNKRIVNMMAQRIIDNLLATS